MNVATNPMILDRAACEKASTIPGRTTAIMATCQSRMDCFMWSVFALLLRSTAALEHIIISINGPDKRTGDPTLQNTKQSFLEELRNTRWTQPSLGHDRDMPLTVMRTWSRIGHSQALDMAIPWVHTEAYTIMHDDLIVNTPDWCVQTFNLLKDNKVGLVYANPLLATGLSYVDFGDSRKINLPHPNSMFITSKKELYTGMGVRWYGHHVKKDFQMMDSVLEFHKDDVTHVPPNGRYGYVSMDVGAWVYYEMKKAGYTFESLKDGTVTHLTAMSWRDDSGQRMTINHHKDVIDKLITDIKEHPKFSKLYEKYLPN